MYTGDDEEVKKNQNNIQKIPKIKKKKKQSPHISQKARILWAHGPHGPTPRGPKSIQKWASRAKIVPNGPRTSHLARY